MAKLTLRTVKEKCSNEKENKKGRQGTVLSPTQEPQKDSLESPVTPGSFKNLKQQKLNFTECAKTEASPVDSKDNISPPPTKKRRQSRTET